MRRLALLLSLPLAAGCAPMEMVDAEPPLPDDLPGFLSETGLVESGVFVDAAAPYEPRWPLWTDGHAKERHLLLPEGTAVGFDETGAFTFPLGTRLAKTVWVEGERVETRVAYKLERGWRLGAYKWDGEEAVLVEEDTTLNGYQVPGRQTCLTCHSGHPSPIGYNAWQLGRVDVPGDDVVSAGVGYLATHCGSCHREGGYAGGTGLHMNLPTPMPVGVEATPLFQTAVLRGLVVPGSPEQSLLFRRFTDEGPARMPPIGTQVMHDDGVAMVRAMIVALEVPGRQPTD